MKVGYFIPSYRRPIKSQTQKIFPFAKVVCAESESESYKQAGNEIIVCPDNVQGNLCRVRNWIIEQNKNNFDAIVLLDDDYQHVHRYCNARESEVKGEDFAVYMENLAEQCRDWGFKFFGVNPASDKQSYSEHTPFSTLSYIGGPLQGFITDTECRYDETLKLKEDYDMTLQNCAKYGGCLRANFLHYHVKQAEQTGGCATYRTTEKERENFNLLKIKWGGIVQYDSKSKRGFDFNPIIRIPLKGV